MHTILVPGLACSARLWDTLIPTAWAHGSVTIADTRADDTLPGIAQRLIAEAPDHFALAGISMGGYICLEVMRLAPQRVQGLALISTSALPDTDEQRDSRLRQIAMVADGRYDELVQAAFPALVDASNADNTPLKDFWATMAYEVGPQAFITQQRAVIDRPDTRPVLADIHCPTAVIHGNGDRTIPVHNAVDTAASIPQAQLTLLDGAGHMAAQEQPNAVADALNTLLRQAADI